MRTKATAGLLVAVALGMTTGARAQSTNTATGYRALYRLEVGDSNTAMGYAAAYSTTNGSYNTALGRSALYSNKGGHDNPAIGLGAMWASVNVTGNTAVGSGALGSMTSGGHNTALGVDSLAMVTASIANVAVGESAIQFLLDGRDNVAVGYGALSGIEYGDNNTILGSEAMFWGLDASNNVAVGFQTLPEGNDCVAVGVQALQVNSTGQYNVAVGELALKTTTTGNRNTAIGHDAGASTGALSNTTALGAGARPTASNSVRIGDDSVTSIGGKVAWSNLSDARFKTNVTEDVPGLRFITRLRPVTFRWNEAKLSSFQGDAAEVSPVGDARKHTGFLAQEVEAAAKQSEFDFSGVIRPANDTTPYQLSYAEFVVPLVKAVQEQQNEIDRLKGALAAQPTSVGTPPWLLLMACALASALGAALVLLAQHRPRRRPMAAATP